MDQKAIIMIKMVCFIIYTEAMNVHQPRYFCGSVLGDTLMKYNCVYHEKALDYVVGYTGIVKECCFQRCSEYDLVKSYCSQSNIDSIMKQSPTTPKGFIEEIPSYSDEVSRNMQKDESLKNGNNYRRHFVDEVGNKRKSNKKKNRKNTNPKKKSCSCKCINTRNPIINKETIVKSPVVGLTNFSRNSIIRVPLRNNNIQKD
ncbi:uncharacterized protein [Onthophagus taurus]|uniref:uncharacterized protein isoform X2 n=1 Tax=Onthophagus taurus TaxID=166361 RepID=UPI000C1FE418|nr:uncharacterized protein LOC111413359 isoform X2 [Onthophagus taurus]